MAYTGRDWDNTGTKVTKEDFKRMDAGIKANDEAITKQATKIEDNTDQINALKDSPNFTGNPTIKSKEIGTIEIATPTLLNGWTEYGGTYQKLIAKKCGEIVNVIGLIKGGTTTSGTSVLQLPSGFRPAATIITTLYTANGTTNRFNLTSDGILTIGDSNTTRNDFLQVNITFVTSS